MQNPQKYQELLTADIEERLVPASEFYYRLGISKSMFYECLKKGQLPEPIRQSPRKTSWKNKVVRDVINKIENGELKLSLAKNG